MPNISLRSKQEVDEAKAAVDVGEQAPPVIPGDIGNIGNVSAAAAVPADVQQQEASRADIGAIGAQDQAADDGKNEVPDVEVAPSGAAPAGSVLGDEAPHASAPTRPAPASPMEAARKAAATYMQDLVCECECVLISPYPDLQEDKRCLCPFCGDKQCRRPAHSLVLKSMLEATGQDMRLCLSCYRSPMCSAARAALAADTKASREAQDGAAASSSHPPSQEPSEVAKDMQAEAQVDFGDADDIGSSDRPPKRPRVKEEPLAKDDKEAPAIPHEDILGKEKEYKTESDSASMPPPPVPASKLRLKSRSTVFDTIPGPASLQDPNPVLCACACGPNQKEAERKKQKAINEGGGMDETIAAYRARIELALPNRCSCAMCGPWLLCREKAGGDDMVLRRTGCIRRIASDDYDAGYRICDDCDAMRKLNHRCAVLERNSKLAAAKSKASSEASSASGAKSTTT